MKRTLFVVICIVIVCASVCLAKKWTLNVWTNEDNRTTDKVALLRTQTDTQISRLLVTGTAAFTTTDLADTVTGVFGDSTSAVVCWKTTSNDSCEIWVTSLTGTTLIVGRSNASPSAAAYYYIVQP